FIKPREVDMLTPEQIEFYNTNGYVVVENVLTKEELQSLRDDFAGWVDESRSHDGPFGETIDGKPRFDLEDGHSAEKPALRRINSPHEISDAYMQVMADSGLTDAVADVVGPDVKLHHTKINSKLPAPKTALKWHQDFPFTPHSNDSLVTALLMVDDVTETNGPL
ncbi:MAG: phytanoyl-CoA dioxygenase family protein, partial [Alphaproteobacteria bacterium]|nr:phytanoyl-CoA dioxygenase family protein [Alphaproteobacteria bacterium]